MKAKDETPTAYRVEALDNPRDFNDAKLLAAATGWQVATANTVLEEAGGLAELFNHKATAAEFKLENQVAAIRALAERWLASKVARGVMLSSAAAAKDYFKALLAGRDYESFHCLFLDQQHHVLAVEELFIGTLSATAVYPREIAKKVLLLGAAAVMLAHNHPSGNPEPSVGDREITKEVIKALQLIDTRVLDHLVIGDTVTSFAERGII